MNHYNRPQNNDDIVVGCLLLIVMALFMVISFLQLMSLFRMPLIIR